MEQPDTTTNPVIRLANVVERISSGKPSRPQLMKARHYTLASRTSYDHELGTAICDALEIEPEPEGEYAVSQIIGAYAELMAMTTEAQAFAEAHSKERARAVNVSYIQTVQSILAQNNHQSSWRVFGIGMPETQLQHLIAVGENMAAYDNEKIVSEDEIHQIVEMLNDLIDQVRQSQIGTRLKDRMVQYLGNLRTQVLRINVVGTETIISAMDTFLGQSVKAVVTAETNTQRQSAAELFLKGISVVGGITQLVEYGGKLWPPLESLAVALKALPENN